MLCHSRIRNWKARAGELKREAYALYLCTRHTGTPLYAKAFALLIIAYAMSPVDLIPDFIPVIGYLDELVLIPLGIALLLKMMPKDVLEECRLKARSLPASKPLRLFGLTMIICIWITAIYLVCRFIMPLF